MNTKMKKENLKLILLGGLALLVGFGGWHIFSYFQKQSASKQGTSEELTTPKKDVFPTIEESKLAEFSEEENKEIREQRTLVEAKGVRGVIDEISESNLVLSSLDGRQSWKVLITPGVRFVNTASESEGKESENGGQISDLEKGMEVKVYATEKIGTKTELKAQKIVYRR